MNPNPITSKERVEIALMGGMPDSIPIVPIYDYGYIMSATGHDIREWITASGNDRTRFIEEGFLLHTEIDGYFVHAGTNNEWVNTHQVEKLDGYWRVTNTKTGIQFGLLPDGSKCSAQGKPVPIQEESLKMESNIRKPEDIDKAVGPMLSSAQIEASGQFDPLHYLSSRYPDRHFSTQSDTPMVGALSACGGYVNGLTTMATDPRLFKKILARISEKTCALFSLARKFGARSTWFTSYYTGADTISPLDYSKLIFPYELEICQEARLQGLFVLNWYLGDLMPNLDTVMKLPIDALVLEQGRKRYTIDPAEIRRWVGPKFCLFGFGYEQDYCTFNRDNLTKELSRQIIGAGHSGAFVVGTPIIPPNARPEAVAFYFKEARRLGYYKNNG